MAKGLTPPENFFISLQEFAGQLNAKFAARSAGEPEDQLKPPVDQLFSAYGKIIHRDIVLKGESTLHNRLGRPDLRATIKLNYSEKLVTVKRRKHESFFNDATVCGML